MNFLDYYFKVIIDENVNYILYFTFYLFYLFIYLYCAEKGEMLLNV